MTGREDKKANDLFFTCSLIEYIARKTKNKPSDIVKQLGEAKLKKIYDLADIYHSDNIDRVSDDLIEACKIERGRFDNVAECRYSVPTHWDIGKVYKRLILSAANEKHCDIIKALIEVYSSFVSDLIEDYNSSFYYENPQTIFYTYINNSTHIEE